MALMILHVRKFTKTMVIRMPTGNRRGLILRLITIGDLLSNSRLQRMKLNKWQMEVSKSWLEEISLL